MRLQNYPGLIELSELELGQVAGSALPFHLPGFRDARPGGEVHGRFSGPPLVGEFGGSYSGPNGGRIGGSITTNGRDWMAGLTAAMTSRNGNTTVSGSVHSNGRDWSVMGSLSHRF